VIRLPKYVAIRPKNTLRLVYRAKKRKLPSLNKARFSLAKVEKVVNPPQNPTVRNILHSEFIISPFSDNPKKIPISKQPKILTKKVP
jgi:hypothetical protein